MSNEKEVGHSRARNKLAPVASMQMISTQAHADALRKKTEVRRRLEDLRIAAQAAHHPYRDKG